MVVRGQPAPDEPHHPAEDTVDALVASLDRCTEADLVVFSGGSSVGERDLIVDAIASRGEMIFHGIAVKPGKPTAFALVKGTPFFGMPGNPTSCLSNAYILLVPYLRALARLPPHTPRTTRVPLGRRIVTPIQEVSAGTRTPSVTTNSRSIVPSPTSTSSHRIESSRRADG